jgi:hypothetical protein
MERCEKTRDVFVHEYYFKILFRKLQSINQETRTVEKYLDKLKSGCYNVD